MANSPARKHPGRRGRKIALPIPFEEAVNDLLKVKPPARRRKKKSQVKRRAAKRKP